MREKLSTVAVILAVMLLGGCLTISPNMVVQPNIIPSDVESLTLQSTIIAFSDEILLSTFDFEYGHHVEPTLAISDNGTIFAGWKNSETHNGGGADVSFTKSIDGGETWDIPSFMSNFESRNTRKSDPWLVWHDDTIYYAYLEFSVSGEELSQITVAKSSDYGTTWTEVAASYGSYFADKETMVISDSGTIFVAYDDIDTEGTGLATVRLTRSDDGGNSFSEVSVIGDPADGHVGPYLTLDNESSVFVAWTYLMEEGGNIYLDNSTDNGVTFGEERFVNSDGNYSEFTSADGRPAKGTLPVIRFDSYNRLYCLWADTFDPSAGSFDVYLRYSEDYGFTWSNRIQISSQSSGDQWMPDMDIDSEDNLHIVYYSEQFGAYKPYYREVSFSGELRDEITLSKVTALTGNLTSAIYTRPGDYFTVRVDSNDIPHVVWTDGRDDTMDIYYTHRADYIPSTTETTTTTMETTSSTTTDATTTTTSLTTDTGIPLSLIIGGVVGFVVILVLALVLFRKSDAS
ncbi:exo-alpha-sialidase [Candidatus Thorarchaeota archaeon]|nr:MAG: exo-alpha-sialidase [Candidatus Thorarchaeota archaeon]